LALHGLETIYRDGEAVGYIRRAEFAFALDKEIAVGYVKNPAGGPVDKEFIMSGRFFKLVTHFNLQVVKAS